MQVELIGCTSAGKTTLTGRIVEAARELGLDVQSSDDFILRCLALNWIGNEFLRRRLIELWALLTCLMFAGKYRALCGFMIGISFAAPGSLLYRVKLARVSLKKVGIFEIVRRRCSAEQIVLLDNEGILQASHTLFVHAAAEPDARSLSDFLEMVPLPDVVVYLRHSESVLAERTRKRGHNRISDASSGEDVELFVRRAVSMFEGLRRSPRLAERLLVIDGERNTLEAGNVYDNPSVAGVADLIRAGLARLLMTNNSHAGKGKEVQALETAPETEE